MIVETIKEDSEMCEKIITKGSAREVDPCLVDEINKLKTVKWNKKFQSIMSCCGHNRYSKTLIVMNRGSGYVFEWFSGISLIRSKRRNSRAPYYKRDKEGYYYIPEVEQCKSGKKDWKDHKLIK